MDVFQKKPYTIPANVEEAEQRLAQAEDDLQELNFLLDDPSRGKKLARAGQYLEWRREALFAKKKLNTTIGRLKEWIKINKLIAPSLINAKAVVRLLWAAYLVLRAIKGRGIKLLDNEASLITELGGYFGSGQKVLEAARSIRKGTIEEVATVGVEIVKATGSPDDLQVLVDNYQRALREGQTESANTQASRALVEGYLTFGQIENAVRVAKGMSPNDADTVKTWLKIYEVDEQAQHLETVRAIAAGSATEAGVKFWTLIFEATGDAQDLERAISAFRNLEKGGADKKRLDGWRILIVKAYLSGEFTNEARSWTNQITDQNMKDRCLAYLAQTSKDKADLKLLLESVSSHPNVRGVLLMEILDALAACSQIDTARVISNACQAGSPLQCAAFARLASYHPDNPLAADDLHKAEAISVKLDHRDNDASFASRELVRALVVAKRLEDAGEVATTIWHHALRSKTCMMVYEAQRNQENSTT